MDNFYNTKNISSKGRGGDTTIRTVKGESSHVNIFEAYLIDSYDKNYPIESEAKKVQPCYMKYLPYLKQGEQPQKTYFSLKRNHLYKPSYTITASYGSGACVMHPFEDRHMSIAELKDICSFPQSFKLIGRYKDQCERLGRSVPPNMMKNIVINLKKEIFNENT